MDKGLDPPVEDSTADQAVNGRVPHCLFLQGAQPPFLVRIVPVYFTDVIMVAVLQERISGHPPVVHLPKAGLKPHCDMGVRASCRVLCLVPCIPGCGTYGKVSLPAPYLGKPGHVSACGAKKTVKDQGLKGNLPGIGDQHPLALGDQCVPVLSLFIKFHRARPEYLFYLQPFFLHRDPLAENILGHRFYPHKGLELIGRLPSLPGEPAVSAEDPQAGTCTVLLVADLPGIGKKDFSFFTFQIGGIILVPFPHTSLFLLEGKGKGLFIKPDLDPVCLNVHLHLISARLFCACQACGCRTDTNLAMVLSIIILYNPYLYFSCLIVYFSCTIILFLLQYHMGEVKCSPSRRFQLWPISPRT
ncbi:hypothetical protein IMSAGC019_01218 [Lachnospiraceae bacterium]|nr:hypothetical protein IMSAGC019_01218 [Lachnospiraceae bacterium]